MTTEEYLAERQMRARELLDIEDLDKRRNKAYELAREFDRRLKNHPALVTQNHYWICQECELAEVQM